MQIRWTILKVNKMQEDRTLDDQTYRRRLLKATAGVAAGGMLSGCLGRQRYQPNRGVTDEKTVIQHVYPSYFDTAGSKLLDRFEQNQNVDFEVAGQVTTAQAVNARSYYLSQFNAKSSRFDVGSMDVIWSGEFVGNGWINTMETDTAQKYLDKMIEPAVDAVTINGTAYAMPLHTDANVLFYRTDLLEDAGFDSPPETYTELVNMAQQIEEGAEQDLNGYIWQGGANEGLTINWLNWLWGMEGSVYDDSGAIRVNSQKSVRALQHAVDLIHDHEVSPKSVQNGSTESDVLQFRNGKTVFMRNFPFALRALQGSPVADKFDFAPLPTHEDSPDASNSCLGGWNLFVNSNSYHEEEATTFVTAAGSYDTQEFLNKQFSLLPVRKELYEEAEDSSLLGRFGDILKTVRRRPLIAEYQRFSEILYTEANRALRREKSPREALDDAQEQMDAEEIGETIPNN
jgi:multiple sugar transport system substrate-binding protein